MKNASLFLLLFCIGAPACAMLKTEQDLPLEYRYIQECLPKPEFKSKDDLKPLVDAYIKECILPRAQSVILEEEADVNYAAHLLLLQRGQKRQIVPFVCANPGCGRAFCASGAISSHMRCCRFALLEQRIKHSAYQCTTCNYGTRSVREFKKHVSKCKRFKKKLELQQLKPSSSQASAEEKRYEN